MTRAHQKTLPKTSIHLMDQACDDAGQGLDRDRLSFAEKLSPQTKDTMAVVIPGLN